MTDEKGVKKAGCVLSDRARALVDKYWPGPLTIILKSKDGKKIGFRMPDNRIALDIVKLSGVPVACPSANISGAVPPKTAKDVFEQLSGKIDVIVDGGKSEIGIESTVIDLTADPPRILREGAIKSEEIAKTISNE